MGHTLTGVWVEILRMDKKKIPDIGHTLTGVWVEILAGFASSSSSSVTPSRVCELKFL